MAEMETLRADVPLVPELHVMTVRCVRCGTWAAMNHTDEECARWRTLRCDPSHEHNWQWVGAGVFQCRDGNDRQGCYVQGEAVMQDAALSAHLTEGTTGHEQ